MHSSFLKTVNDTLRRGLLYMHFKTILLHKNKLLFIWMKHTENRKRQSWRNVLLNVHETSVNKSFQNKKICSYRFNIWYVWMWKEVRWWFIFIILETLPLIQTEYILNLRLQVLSVHFVSLSITVKGWSVATWRFWSNELCWSLFLQPPCVSSRLVDVVFKLLW